MESSSHITLIAVETYDCPISVRAELKPLGTKTPAVVLGLTNVNITHLGDALTNFR